MTINPHFSALRFLAILSVSIATAVTAQEALEIKADQEPEPTPIEQKKEQPKEKPAEKKTIKRERTTGNIEDMMTSNEFNSAGLSKLSMEELKNLNAWLQGYRQTTEKKATEKATAEVTEKVTAEVSKKASESKSKLDMILSRVDGEFNGVNGHTVIKLEDGTTWKQANADDRFHASVTNRPPVRVVHGPFGYKMRVVGTGEFYVNPVR